MSQVLKKTYVAFAGFFMAVVAQVNGIAADPFINNQWGAPSCCETPCCTPPTEIIVWGDVLYWRPELCGLEAAFGSTAIDTSVAGGIITTTITESDEEPDGKWSPGFRIGADVRLDCVDVVAAWTHYNGRASFHSDSGHGSWKIHYDTIDLVLAKSWSLCPSVNVRPFIGVRGLRVHQTLSSHLETAFTSIIGNNTVITELNDRENFAGAGPELGLEADFAFGCGFRVFGVFDVVSYYGSVKSRHAKTDTFTSTVSVCNGRKTGCFSTIGTDAAIGIIWDKTLCYCGCETDFFLKLSLEQHRIYDFSNLGSDGNLSLDGGSLGLGIGFSY